MFTYSFPCPLHSDTDPIPEWVGEAHTPRLVWHHGVEGRIHYWLAGIKVPILYYSLTPLYGRLRQRWKSRLPTPLVARVEVGNFIAKCLARVGNYCIKVFYLTRLLLFLAICLVRTGFGKTWLLSVPSDTSRLSISSAKGTTIPSLACDRKPGNIPECLPFFYPPHLINHKIKLIQSC